MTSRKHFERWMKHAKPNMPLDYNEQEGYHYHDIVHLMFVAWDQRSKVRPTENSKITKEQLAKDHPETLVDRLNGIYPLGDVSPVPPIQKEAAREIGRLRDALLPFAAYSPHYPKDRKYGNRVTEGEWHSVASGGLGMAQIDVEDFHRAASLTNNKKPAEAG